MEVGGFNRETDWSKMGPSLVIASSLILAIRTAKWPRIEGDTTSNRDWEAEIEHSIRLARRILSHLVLKSPTMFQSRNVPWYQPTDEDQPK